MSFLIANLAIAASDEEKLKDAFHNALQWEYSSYTSPIYAIYISQPKTALLFAQKELVADLQARPAGEPFQLGGPMSATFTNVSNFPSNCVEIEFSDETKLPDIQYDTISHLRETVSNTNFGSFIRGKFVCLRFANADETNECLKILAALKNSSIHSRIISVHEHVTLRCGWKGSATLASTMKRLKSTGQNITYLVQSCIGIWPQQPLVLSIHPSPREDEVDGKQLDEAVIFCATRSDALLLQANPLIEIVGGSSFNVFPNQLDGSEVALTPTIVTKPSEPENVELVTDIPLLAVAIHMKNLMVWADKAYNPRKLEFDQASKKQVDKFRNAAVNLTSKKFLMGEREDGEKEEESPCALTILIDQKEKKYRLKIVGPTAELADFRHKRLSKMVNSASKDRKLHTLTGWDISHREAIMGSLPLSVEERESESTALFHYNDGTIVVEIVSLTGKHHRQLQKFIEGLDPKEAQWAISRDTIVSYDDKKWAEIQFQYAVLVDKESATSKNSSNKSATVSLRVRGFGGHIDSALSNVLESNLNVATANVNISSISSSALSILNAPFSSQGTDKVKADEGPVSGTYSFVDRESGVFYRAYENDFRRFCSYEFGVDVAPSTSTTTEKSGSGLRQQTYQQTTVNISFTGPDARKVNSCRNYLEQINPSNLQKHQIFFPRLDERKYREILIHKNGQETALQKIRDDALKQNGRGSFDSDCSSDAMLDPMSAPGFVSIRIKVHNRGGKRPLPTEVTIIVTCPSSSSEQIDCLKTVVNVLESIDCVNYFFSADLPTTSSITRQLSAKNARDDFVTIHGLMGLRYEEASKGSGIAGTVKLFASNEQVLMTVLQFMKENGAQNCRIGQNGQASVSSAADRASFSLVDASTPLSPVQSSLELDSLANLTDELDLNFSLDNNNSNKSGNNVAVNSSTSFTSMFSSFPGPSNGGNNFNVPDPEGPPPGLFNLGAIGNHASTTSWGNAPTTTASSLALDPLGRDNMMLGRDNFAIGGGSGSAQLGGPKLGASEKSGSIGSLSDIGLPSQTLIPSTFGINSQMTLDFGGLGIEPINTVPGEKRVVRWPHHSFRFMFLGEPLKQNLVDLLTKIREKHNLNTTYPHRDKSDHSACLLLEGSQISVNAAAEDINKYMRTIYQQMRCLQLVISEVDKKELISNDLNRVKDIQGLCGVHLVLDPLPTDMNEASSTYDLRLPYTDHLLFETPIVETESENEFKPLRELLSVVVTSKVTGQNVVVSVIDNKSSTGGWNWGVNNVLLMLDPSADVGLNYTEIEQLDKGEVLVNTENATGKRILRVRPERSSFQTRGIERQAEGFVAALSRGLAAADSLSINGIAVVAPTSTQYFTDLSVELIQSLTMEAIVAFIRRAPVRHLSKILCIEMQSQLDDQLTPVQYTEMSLLLPAGGDRMALTLLILLEQANDPNNQIPVAGITPTPSIQLRTCNVPLPRNVRADDLLPSLAKNRQKTPALPNQIPPVGTSPIILRGLTGGLRTALKTIKQLISSYAEARKATENNPNRLVMNSTPSILDPRTMMTMDHMN